jgi:hypothetical protein
VESENERNKLKEEKVGKVITQINKNDSFIHSSQALIVQDGPLASLFGVS